MTTTLAEHLRALPDKALAALLAMRPDLLVPVPPDISGLAVRAQSRVSVARALDPLDRFTLEILDALRWCRDGDLVSLDAVLALTASARPAPAAAEVRAAVDRLRAVLIVFGPDSALHIAAGVDEACSPFPAGLGKPARDLNAEVATLCADPAKLRRAVLAAPPPSRAVLDRLADGPPLGSASASAIADPDTPVGWLVSHNLLAIWKRHESTDVVEVQLPEEIGLLLRREVGPFGLLHPEPPTLDAPNRPAKAIDSAGAGQVMEAVRQVEILLEALTTEPVVALKSGGIGVRDLRRLARAASLDEGTAALLLEVAAAAGLLGEAEPGAGRGEPAETRFLPTVAFDAWRALRVSARWAPLARAWLLLPRQPGLAGRRDERDRLAGVLAPELNRHSAPRLRAAALTVLADGLTGAAPDADQVFTALAWRSPRMFGLRPGTPAGGASLAAVGAGDGPRTEAISWALTEAAQLGITGLGALTAFGRALFTEVRAAANGEHDDDPLGIKADRAAPTAIEVLEALLPTPVDHFLVQADLTVVVPGPAEADLAAELALIAEPESAGGASVYRVTAESLRRALDAGYPPADLHAVFARRSRTPVPQGLSYLIDDVARRHGGLRAGSAGSYLRSEDTALMAELLADRRLASLRLRRLAPGVLVTAAPSVRLVAALRDAGYAPVPEDATGAAVLSRPALSRAAPRPHRPDVTSFVDGPARPAVHRLAGIVEQIRRGDAAARASRRAPVTLRDTPAGATAAQAHTQAMATLQQALRDKQRVWVGYVDAHGSTAARLVRPVSMAAGYLRAEDDRTETLHTFALHRITGAVLEGD